MAKKITQKKFVVQNIVQAAVSQHSNDVLQKGSDWPIRLREF